jgi:hypothetical protein
MIGYTAPCLIVKQQRQRKMDEMTGDTVEIILSVSLRMKEQKKIEKKKNKMVRNA